MATKVVNVYKEPYDVYIGRKGRGHDGYFGNPYRIDSWACRSDALADYKFYFLDRINKDPEFKRRVLELKDKTLGCFCKPERCHGDIIAEWVDSQKK